MTEQIQTNNNICKQHSGFDERLKGVENDVNTLLEKWDGMQKLVIGIFVAFSLNLIGIIAILLKN